MTGTVHDLRSEVDGLPLPGTPWSVRFAAGTRRRPALEIHEDGSLLDVLVAGGLAPAALCGARRTRHATLAWGYLTPGGTPPTVVFRRGLRRRAVRIAHPAAGRFWLALAPGAYGSVRIAGTADRLRADRGR
jgi:hypothetical protein